MSRLAVIKVNVPKGCDFTGSAQFVSLVLVPVLEDAACMLAPHFYVETARCVGHDHVVSSCSVIDFAHKLTELLQVGKRVVNRADSQ